LRRVAQSMSEPLFRRVFAISNFLITKCLYQ
jgi:hypothetical protein